MNSCVPRTRGAEPRFAFTRVVNKRAFPAPAGLNRAASALAIVGDSVPRTRGAEPL